jgi:hypothetical protein
MLFALENKIKQYAQTLGTDPDTKDENLPANVEAFQSAVASFRELRRVGKVVITVPLPEPSKKPASPKKVSLESSSLLYPNRSLAFP